jgi:hypothetical protein
MKKALIICCLGTSLLIFALACNQTQTPSVPVTNNVIYRPMDLVSPTSTLCVPIPDPSSPISEPTFNIPSNCPGKSSGVSFFDVPMEEAVVNGTATPVPPFSQSAGITASLATYFCYVNIPPDLTDGSDPNNWRVVINFDIIKTRFPVTITGCVNGQPGIANNLAGNGEVVSDVPIPEGLLRPGVNKVELNLPLPPQMTFISAQADVVGCLILLQAPTSTPTPSPTPTCPGGNIRATVTAYTQFDPRWLTTPMDHDVPGPVTTSTHKVFIDQHTIQTDGCFMTCLAMLAGQTPPSVDDTLTANNRISRTGNLDPQAAANDLGFTINGTIVDATDDDVTLTLENNDFVIAVLNHNGRQHYVVVTGGEFNTVTGKCDFAIKDPGSSRHVFLSDYDLSMVMGLTKN